MSVREPVDYVERRMMELLAERAAMLAAVRPVAAAFVVAEPVVAPEPEPVVEPVEQQSAKGSHLRWKSKGGGK